MKKLALLALGLVACAPQASPDPAAAALEARAERVTIIRDDWGIPHIYAPTDADAVWSSPVPGKDRPVMREVFRTYGGDFPRSLPHPEPPATGRLTVVSRLQGLAYPVSGITATVGPQVVDTGVDGLARFALPAGETEVLLTGQ